MKVDLPQPFCDEGKDLACADLQTETVERYATGEGFG